MRRKLSKTVETNGNTITVNGKTYKYTDDKNGLIMILAHK